MRKVLGIGAAVLCSLVVLFMGCSAPSTPSASEPVLDKIEITNQPNKKEYHIGDEIDLTGMVVTAIYNDGSTKTLASNEYTVTGFDSTAAVESQKIKVTYGEKTATFIVKITSVLLTRIEITNPPNKKEYFVGAAQLDLTGLKVTATYTDGSTADVTDKVTTSGFDSSTATESQPITVTYEGKTATFDVKITSVLVTGIEITNQPNKKEYFVGASQLDLTGLKVTATYTDGSTADVTDKVTTSGFDSSTATESQTITLTYEGKTATFDVKINPVIFTGISITNPPNKKEYFVGAAQLNLTGLKVTATYTDGSTADVTDKVTTSGFDSSTATESQTITVTYEGKTATFTVKIKQGYTFHNEVTTLPSGTGSYGTDATYVEFGDWPQDVVPTEEVATLGLETSKDKVTRGYMEFVQGTDGNYYVKHESKWFKVMPIKWRVADQTYIDKSGSSQGKLLVAENILTANVPYYEDDEKNRIIDGKTVYPNNYMHSQIRAYLNGYKYTGYDTSSSSNVEKTQWNNNGFLQTAFTSEAIDSIITTKVDNSEDSTTDVTGYFDKATKYACDPTEDKIFLLSEYEVTKYSKSTEGFSSYGKGNSRIRGTTDFAKANNAFQDANDGYGGNWWLRSPDYENIKYARDVSYEGNAFSKNLVNATRSGVVPALAISF